MEAGTNGNRTRTSEYNKKISSSNGYVKTLSPTANTTVSYLFRFMDELNTKFTVRHEKKLRTSIIDEKVSQLFDMVLKGGFACKILLKFIIHILI